MVKKILIIEDDIKILNVISSYMINAGYITSGSLNGIEGMNLFRKNSYDLVLLDLMLPDLSGERICKMIRENSSIPIIMITAKSDETSIISGLEMGADDYVTKPFSPRQLVARVNALFRRCCSTEEANSEVHLFQLDESAYSISYKNEVLPLTAYEYYLLRAFLKRPSKVFTRDELVSQLKEGAYDGLARGIDSHIKNIRAKLSQVTDFPYITTVRGIGYTFNDQERNKL